MSIHCELIVFFMISVLFYGSNATFFNWLSPSTLPLTMVKCGQIAILNNSIFVNEDFPNPLFKSDSCRITVVKLFNVKQILVQLVKFELNDPIDGHCKDESLVISGHDNLHLPPLCGKASGQHLYLPVDKSLKPITLTITTSDSKLHRKTRQAERIDSRWMIRIIQLEENNPLLAPDGCLQYYNGTTNTLQSFNLNSRSILMAYAICIKREVGFCSIGFEPSPVIVEVSKLRRTRAVNYYQQNYPYPYQKVSYRPHYQVQYKPDIYDKYNKVFDNVKFDKFGKINKIEKLDKLDKVEKIVAKPTLPPKPVDKCAGKNSLVFPTLDNGEDSVVCGDFKPVVTHQKPYVIYVHVRDPLGPGFQIKYHQIICSHV